MRTSLSLSLGSCLQRENTKRRLNTIERGDKAEELFEHDWQRESFHFIPSEDRCRVLSTLAFFSFLHMHADTRTLLSVSQSLVFHFSIVCELSLARLKLCVCVVIFETGTRTGSTIYTPVIVAYSLKNTTVLRATPLEKAHRD